MRAIANFHNTLCLLYLSRNPGQNPEHYLVTPTRQVCVLHFPPSDLSYLLWTQAKATQDGNHMLFIQTLLDEPYFLQACCEAQFGHLIVHTWCSLRYHTKSKIIYTDLGSMSLDIQVNHTPLESAAR